MYFIASKVFWTLAAPTTLLMLGTALGLALLFTPWRRTGRVLAVLGFAGLLVCAYSPLGNLLLVPLEERFPRWTADGGPYAGIIVLGGPVEETTSNARDMLTFNESGERLVAMADLARRYPDLPVVFTGGSAGLRQTGPAEADIVERHLATLGLAPGRVLFERRSRNTVENAALTRELLGNRTGRYLLVTSAFHMPRSVGLFRRAGFTVVPVPVDFRTGGPQDAWRPFTLPGDGIRRVEIVTREWIGLAAARLLGQTDALLPGP